jgi:hypothetical protein
MPQANAILNREMLRKRDARWFFPASPSFERDAPERECFRRIPPKPASQLPAPLAHGHKLDSETAELGATVDHSSDPSLGERFRVSAKG